jgi:hypothetical protein
MIPSLKLINDVDLLVTFDYNASVVEEIKKQIPWPGYKWDKAKKAWIIRSDFIEEICAILTTYFHTFHLDPSCEKVFEAYKKIDETFVPEGL